MSDKLKYNAVQRKEYLNMMDRVAGNWLAVFSGNELFYSAQYWDLFTKLWRSEKPVTKTEALKFMTGVKSAHTAGRYVETALAEGLLVEWDNPGDKRSKFIALAPDMQTRLDSFFDKAVSEVRGSSRTMEIVGPAPAEP